MFISDLDRKPKPLVTIAIPTYNRAESYLRTALESALQQTYELTEVLVVDNASTDDTPELVRSYEADHPQLNYIRRPENRGPIDNFQRSLDAAEGDFFLMLHDDDCIDPDFISTCMEAANHDINVGYIRTGIRIIDIQGNTIQEYPNDAGDLQQEEYINAWLQFKMYWYFSSSLMNTRLLRSTGGFNNEFDLLIDMATFSKCVFESRGVNVRSIKASLREHQDRITAQIDVAKWIEELKKVKKLIVGRSSQEWKSTIASRTDKFFGWILCQRVDNIPNKGYRFNAYIQIARAFGLQSVPRPLSKVVRCTVPVPVEKYLEQKVHSWRSA